MSVSRGVSWNRLLRLTVLAVAGLGFARGELGVVVDESDVLEVLEEFGPGIGGVFVTVDERDVAEFMFSS